MSQPAILNLCQCCGEDCEKIAAYCPVLGQICGDCHEGATAGMRALWRKRIAGVFTGPCGDNGRKEAQP